MATACFREMLFCVRSERNREDSSRSCGGEGREKSLGKESGEEIISEHETVLHPAKQSGGGPFFCTEALYHTT